MVDQLKRYREPLAVVVAVVVAVNLVLDIVGEVLAARHGVVDALRGANEVGLVSVLCVLLTAGLCWLVEPVTRHARAIALAAALIVSAATLVALVNLIGTLLAPAATFAAVLEAIGGGTDLALKAVAAFVLWQLARRRDHDETPSAVVAAAPADQIEPAQPTWSRETAAGASWQSARQAATGAAPGRWGSAPSGWGAAAGELASRPDRPAQAPATESNRPSNATAQPPTQAVSDASGVEQSAPSGDPLHGPAAHADRSLWNPRR